MKKTVLINQFNGGLVEDKRSGWAYQSGGATTNKYSLTKHFDAFTYPHKLVPQYATEVAGTDSVATVRGYNFLQFLYAPYQGTYSLYGLGVSGSFSKLYYQSIDSGSDLDTLSWTAAANGTAAGGSQIAGMFFFYKDYIYLMQSTTQISRFKTTATTAFTDNWQTPATTTTPIQPVHHPSDDVAYFFSDNHVYSWNDSAWTDALTLPSNMTIVAACAWGNYLAIGMTTAGSENKKSVVFLWDRDSSLTTLTERIDFGTGTLKYLANLQGRLIGVMDYYATNSFALNKGKILIKRANGIFADIISELEVDSVFTSPTTAANYFVEDNRLYFVMAAPLNGDTRFGIWAVDYNGRLALDTIETNASQVSYYNAIYKTAQIWWIGYYDGTGNVVSRSMDEATYSGSLSSVYETLIFNDGDPSRKKKILGVTVMTEPLSSAGTIVLKYRRNVQSADGTVTTETSWTTIFTHTVDNSVSHDAVNIESGGSNLPSFNEIQFQVNSTGGATITGLRFEFETVPDNTY